MARVAVTELQRRGAINNGWGLYNLKAGWSGSVRYGLPAVKAGVPYYTPDWNPPHTPRGDVFHGRGLAATCPEGSRTVNGECVCYDGRVWMPDKSKCVSPQSPAYIQAVGGGATTHEDQGSMSSAAWAQQTLTDSARRYIESQGHTIRCQIDPNWAQGPQGGVPAMLCSIDGGEYIHAAYAINQNPSVALLSQQRQVAVARYVEAAGATSGVYTTPESTAAIDQIIRTGQVDQGQVQQAQATSDLKQQLHSTLVAGVDYDKATGAPLSWKAEVAGSNQVTTDLVQEALNLPPGATLQDPSGVTNQQAAGYVPGGAIPQWSGGSGGSGGGSGAGGSGGSGGPSDPGIGFSADGIPWWVWAAGAGAAYFALKGK